MVVGAVVWSKATTLATWVLRRKRYCVAQQGVVVRAMHYAGTIAHVQAREGYAREGVRPPRRLA